MDTIERLLSEGRTASEGASLLLLISAVLLGKEVVNTGVRYGQNLFGEKIRVNVSSRLAQAAVERILTYRLAFYTHPDNQTGILQTRIDRGAESLTKLVQSAFIDILPLFAGSILALVIMFLANVYVGLVGAAILPVYFLLSQRQASMLKGARRGLRALREEKNNGLHDIIESVVVIKSFVREGYEKEKQTRLQRNLVGAQWHVQLEARAEHPHAVLRPDVRGEGRGRNPPAAPASRPLLASPRLTSGRARSDAMTIRRMVGESSTIKILFIRRPSAPRVKCNRPLLY